jgi:hypothetical protein
MDLSIFFHRLQLLKNQEKLGLEQNIIGYKIINYLIINLL